MTDFVLGKAKLRTKADVDVELSEKAKLASAAAQAEQIIQEAKGKATEIQAVAVKQWDTHSKKIRSIADEQLVDFVDKQKLDVSTKAIAELIENAKTIRTDFDAMTPWLNDLILALLSNILGDLEPQERWKKLITQGLGRLDDRWDLTLRCHPCHTHELHQVLLNDAELNAAIKQVRPDENLSPDHCFIESASEALDISLPTQIDTLRDLLVRHKGGAQA